MAERFAKSRWSLKLQHASGAQRPGPPVRLDWLDWLLSLAVCASTGCTTYRAYSGEAREPNKIAVLDCDPEGVVVRRVESYPFDGGWSEFELLPGTRKVSAELFWTRLEKRVELPEKSTTFVAKAGERYRCVFDVNEQTHDWALAVVPESQVSWKSRTFHGARSWRTPSGDCLIWDPKQRGCLGDPAKQSDPAPTPTEEPASEIGPERP